MVRRKRNIACRGKRCASWARNPEECAIPLVGLAGPGWERVGDFNARVSSIGEGGRLAANGDRCNFGLDFLAGRKVDERSLLQESNEDDDEAPGGCRESWSSMRRVLHGGEGTRANILWIVD